MFTKIKEALNKDKAQPHTQTATQTPEQRYAQIRQRENAAMQRYAQRKEERASRDNTHGNLNENSYSLLDRTQQLRDQVRANREAHSTDVRCNITLSMNKK